MGFGIPGKNYCVHPDCNGLKHSPQQIAFNEVIRQSIMADPAWRNGYYYEDGQPENGLAVARMIGHITFMSDQSMEQKFSRKLKNDNLSFQFTTILKWKSMPCKDWSGWIPITWICGLCSRRKRPTPVSVPDVPRPATKCVKAPPVCCIISGPVLQ